MTRPLPSARHVPPKCVEGIEQAKIKTGETSAVFETLERLRVARVPVLFAAPNAKCNSGNSRPKRIAPVGSNGATGVQMPDLKPESPP
jgi:hypothetical protein